MNSVFFIEQLLNGIGYGLILFLLAAGLTLVFGIMDTLNLAHGSLFMVGGYLAATVHAHTGSFLLAIVLAIAVTVLLAMLLEALLVRRLYKRDHLAQVLATFGIILVMDDLVRYVWGPTALRAPTPEALQGPLQLLPGLPYSSYRLVILAAGVVVAALLYALVKHTRIGVEVRAGASNRQMAELMGVRVDRVFLIVFALGAALAALAGALLGPLTSVEAGMGEAIMIPALVVIVIGGIGSVRGAFVAALLIGLIDTSGRAFLPVLFRTFLSPSIATDVGSAVASVAMYVAMAIVLVVKPAGLFPARA